MMSVENNWDNPYSGGLEAANTSETTPTNIPHTLGILNIVFGIFLLLCFACYGMQVVAHGLLGTSFIANQQQFQQAMEQERQKQLDNLEERANNADTEQEADALRKQREAMKNMPTPKFPDMSNMMGMKDPGAFATYLFDCLSGVILNVLMLISGIGLLKFQSWARRMAVWVAVLKIICLIIYCALAVVVLAPAVSNGFVEFVTEMNPDGPRPQPGKIEEVKSVFSGMVTGWGVTLLVLGSIYPLISLRLLSRRDVVAACQKKTISPNTF
jgi:hypothetical protein